MRVRGALRGWYSTIDTAQAPWRRCEASFRPLECAPRLMLQLDAVDVPVNHRCAFVIDNGSDSGTPAARRVPVDARQVFIDPVDARRVTPNVSDIEMVFSKPQQKRHRHDRSPQAHRPASDEGQQQCCS